MVKIFAPSKVGCKVCGKSQKDISGYLKVCRDCLKEGSEKAKKLVFEAHSKAREKISLPAFPPKDPKGILCNICGNECQIPEEGRHPPSTLPLPQAPIGYCGLSKNLNGKLSVIWERLSGV